MTKLTLDRDTILRRMNGIQSELHELAQLSRLPFNEFANGVGYKLAQFHLHRALEGVFHIASHILSRIPGAQVSEYRELAKQLGERRVLSMDYACTTLVKMAGYRNRLVHFYAEVTPEELHALLREHLGDFDPFFQGVKNVLERPGDFGIQ